MAINFEIYLKLNKSWTETFNLKHVELFKSKISIQTEEKNDGRIIKPVIL